MDTGSSGVLAVKAAGIGFSHMSDTPSLTVADKTHTFSGSVTIVHISTQITSTGIVPTVHTSTPITLKGHDENSFSSSLPYFLTTPQPTGWSKHMDSSVSPTTLLLDFDVSPTMAITPHFISRERQHGIRLRLSIVHTTREGKHHHAWRGHIPSIHRCTSHAFLPWWMLHTRGLIRGQLVVNAMCPCI